MEGIRIISFTCLGEFPLFLPMHQRPGQRSCIQGNRRLVDGETMEIFHIAILGGSIQITSQRIFSLKRRCRSYKTYKDIVHISLMQDAEENEVPIPRCSILFLLFSTQTTTISPCSSTRLHRCC